MQYSAYYSQKFKHTTHSLTHSLTRTDFIPLHLIAKLEFKGSKSLICIIF